MIGLVVLSSDYAYSLQTRKNHVLSLFCLQKVAKPLETLVPNNNLIESSTLKISEYSKCGKSEKSFS